jgi:hypothetical protein
MAHRRSRGFCRDALQEPFREAASMQQGSVNPDTSPGIAANEAAAADASGSGKDGSP